MADFVQFGDRVDAVGSARSRRTILWLEGVTLAWMLVECGVALYAAATARSTAMLAFGSDSLVELLSATVVLLQFVPGVRLSARRAANWSALLLFMLSACVAGVAAASLYLGLRPETTASGIAITVAALVAMPVLALLKRREARRTGNAALAADAVQSATCAYLALTALAGVAMNAVLHIPWIDSLAALIAVPILIREALLTSRGQGCACCG